MAIVKISDLPLVDQPVEGTDLFVVVQDNVTKKAYASDIQTYVGFEEFQTATAGQTVFNLTTMTYAAGANNLQVFVDGVNQYVGTSYLETDNNTVTFTQGLHQGALVKFATVQTLSTVDTSSANILFTQGGTGAVTRSVQSKLRDTVSVKDFGAVGNGIADDTAAIQAAILACTLASQTSLFFPTGTYIINSTITLGAASARGIALIGEIATPQQGSARPAVTFRWTGGAAAMFDIQNTYFRFYNISFENFTSATDVFLLTEAMHMVIDGCSFTVGSGASRFSRSVMHCAGNEFGYSVVSNCEIVNPAPRFLDIDGQGTANGITPVLFYNNVIESNSLGAHTVVYVKDEVFDILTFNANTFNGQANAQLTIVNTTDTPASETIAVLNFYDNELDLVANTATDRCFRLTNVSSANFWGNQIAAGGSVAAIATLVNSVVTQFSGNNVISLSGPFFSADSTSRVYAQSNAFNPANTNGIVNDNAATSGMIQMPYGATVSIQGERGVATGHTVFRVDVTNTAGFTLTFAHPGIGGSGFFTRGQVFSVQVRNVSGGSIASITLAGGATYWSLAGGAFPIPANGNSRTVNFVWSGSKLVEIGRTENDIPN